MEENCDSKKSDILYDYIKFHIGLYLATPPVYALIAEALLINSGWWYISGLILLILTSLISGSHACLFVSKYLFTKEESEIKWSDMGKKASCSKRRLLQHHLYWFGLIFSLIFLTIAGILKLISLKSEC